MNKEWIVSKSEHAEMSKRKNASFYFVPSTNFWSFGVEQYSFYIYIFSEKRESQRAT